MSTGNTLCFNVYIKTHFAIVGHTPGSEVRKDSASVWVILLSGANVTVPKRFRRAETMETNCRALSRPRPPGTRIRSILDRSLGKMFQLGNVLFRVRNVLRKLASRVRVDRII